MTFCYLKQLLLNRPENRTTQFAPNIRYGQGQGNESVESVHRTVKQDSSESEDFTRYQSAEKNRYVSTTQKRKYTRTRQQLRRIPCFGT